MNFENTLFRCSSLGHIMTEPQKKTETLSETCKTHLIDVFVQNKYGRQSDISNRYMEKGLMVEEDSITLYSRVKKTFFKKNELGLSNTVIKGTPDLFTGLEISAADIIIDIKSSWDIYTFFRVHTQAINKMYYWQLQGYMMLTGARKAKLVYCLVDTPETLIMDEKRKLFYRMNAGTEENREYQKACEELDIAMRFGDIPMIDRVIEIEIDRNDEDIKRIEQRVIDCRVFLGELEQKICPSVLIAERDKQLNATIIKDGVEV